MQLGSTLSCLGAQALRAAKTGIYCRPLRQLAMDVYDQLTGRSYQQTSWLYGSAPLAV